MKCIFCKDEKARLQTVSADGVAKAMFYACTNCGNDFLASIQKRAKVLRFNRFPAHGPGSVAVHKARNLLDT